MLALTDYKLKKNLYQGTRTEVYRGMRASDRRPVIVKVLRNPHPSFNELVQFRNQYVITSHLEHSHIVHPLTLERCGNGYALVMPDEGAIALPDYWQQSDRSLAEFLSIAIQLADALHYLSGQRIIHKDIKPANILIHPKTRQAKLIDFSISSLLPKEQQQLINPNVLEGTLAYISPEQTGRMNRGIDYRTDFYGLGVTFFELLTGKLPFATSEPMELVHCHIAQEAEFPADSKIPEVVQAIVLKLMAKNAEDRYQSALGLKHDLKKCLQEWKTTGKITPFGLGQQDRCDRFLIPEKLYGRETEVQTLLDAFERVAAGNTEMILVAGFSGTGKTAVLSEVHKPIVKKRGYFIKGKFDQFNRNIPLSAFAIAFRDLMGQLLGESDASLANWKTNILEALGENGQVIIEVIPELERIIGPQPPVAEISGSAAQKRFNLLLQKFIAVFATPEHPLTIFLDDLQWADSASLNLIKVLMDDGDTGCLLLLGAYRDNEVFPGHPLILTLSDLEPKKAVISKILLEPLALKHINQLVAETLSCSEDIAIPLADLIYQKTQGNPFFATQFLKGLHQDELINFNLGLAYWECDLVKVRDAALTDDVLEFMAGRLALLPEATQKVLKLAACIGNQFDLQILAIVCEQSEEQVAADIWFAVQEGLILPISEAYKFFQGGLEESVTKTVRVAYRFLHDRVQQAAYSRIDPKQRQATHLQMGQILLNNLPKSELDSHIFEIVNHLNVGADLILQETEREELAQLNLMAGRKAKAATAYSVAIEYFNAGIEIVANCGGWQHRYALTLNLYVEAAETQYLHGYFEKAQQLVAVVIEGGNNLLDKIPAYETKIQIYISQNRLDIAIETALYLLEELGYPLLSLPDESWTLSLPAIADLPSIPEMTDPKQLAAMRILANITHAVYVGKPDLFGPVVLTMVSLALEYGISSLAAIAYSSYGWLMAGVGGNIDLAYQAGLLSLRLLEQLDAREFKCKVFFNFFAMTQPWKEHFQASLVGLEEGLQSGLATGDLEIASYSAMFQCFFSYFGGTPLDRVAAQQDIALEQLKTLKVEYSFYHASIWRQMAATLQGEAEEQTRLLGDYFNEIEVLPLLEATNNQTSLFSASVAKTILFYLNEDYERAVATISATAEEAEMFKGWMMVGEHNFFCSLALLAHYSDVDLARQEEFRRLIEKNQAYMQIWASSGPANFGHKYELVAAEKERVLGNRWAAADLYDRAIAGAKANKYLQEEALANEVAAKLYLNWGKEKVAAGYMQEAYYCYAHWGAKAKTDQLEAKYPQLLFPILQKQGLELNSRNSLENVTQTLVSNTHTKDSSTGLSDTLDLASLLQAAQALSRTIELDRLLADISQIILTNAGAQKAALLIPQAEQWQLRAMAALASDGTIATNTQPQPLSAESPVPFRLIQYVKNTREPVLIDRAKTDISSILEGYLLERQPQSVLCFPLLDRGKLVAILYLEHPTVKGVFTRDRQNIVKFLCAQAAISLQNAQLYERAQQALLNLQQAQLQLVQSEKMSALGNLVAGVAHEINNPTGFLQGNIEPARDYVRDLLGLINLYRAEYPQPSKAIQEELEAIDLEFIREDLPNLLESMNLGVERIRHISNSLRTFSRTDQESKTSFNIHEGIDSTLLILKHRTKASEQRPAIEIVKDYADIPEVQCFPGQLNQVFMNLLANAIDAFEEAKRGKSSADIKANLNRITIRTSILDKELLQIQIQDNGCGMKPETKKRIFEQGFTTKGVGKGTGLGMAIARQIVVERHGGTITCFSELGKGTEFIIFLPLGRSLTSSPTRLD